MGDVKYCALKRTLKSIFIWFCLPAISIIIGVWLMICKPMLLFTLIILAMILLCIGCVIYFGYEMLKDTYEHHLRDCTDEYRTRKQKEGIHKP
jgi:archaellum biogenesis protein FlaJ (TadC family)